MKKILSILCLLFLILFQLQVTAQPKKRHKTPKVYNLSQKQKDNQNFDLKQSKKIIAHNIKHKKSNQKAAEKKRQVDTENLIELNKSAKVKKEKKNTLQAFTFYH